jgi:HlyD family secretion protein
VFLVVDGKAHFQPVKVGIAGEKEFEVLEGLSEGDQIVTGNFQVLRNLKHGDKVKPAEKKDNKSKDRDRKGRDSED